MPQLGLRLLLACEFWESGVEKYRGENWFADIMDRFPIPFDVIPADISWFISTQSELIGAVALVIGLGTRLVSVTLVIVTVVAWVSVHAGNGYNVCDNGFKLPLMYLVMLLPLISPGRENSVWTISLPGARCQPGGGSQTPELRPPEKGRAIGFRCHSRCRRFRERRT